MPLFSKAGDKMFTINNVRWDIVFVRPSSHHLERSDGSLTVGVTDWNDRCVYMSDMLRGPFFEKVLCHELCHCFCMSYDIHMPIEEEEFMADWISMYGKDLVYLLDDLMSSVLRKTA